jgi:hypothetical protein
MENTFDINNFSSDTQSGRATYNQCKGLSYKFAKTGDKINWKLQKQILGCLYGLSKRETHFLTFKKANELFSKKSLPKVYLDAIALYLKENS